MPSAVWLSEEEEPEKPGLSVLDVNLLGCVYCEYLGSALVCGLFHEDDSQALPNYLEKKKSS